jgi:hypothetical protein
MSKTFYLRFVPFGTAFRRSEGRLRQAVNEPETSALCDNEVSVDVGGRCFGCRGPERDLREESLIFDHHFTGHGKYPSASAAVLHHAADLVGKLDAYDPVWIVTHREPDFDALCAAYLVKALLDGPTASWRGENSVGGIDLTALPAYGIHPEGWRDLKVDDGQTRQEIDWFNPQVHPLAPIGWAVLLAAYASCVDQGKRLYADRSRRLHSVLYAALIRGRPVHEDGLKPLFDEARKAIVIQGRNPIFDPLFDEHSEFLPELELLRHEERTYERDLLRARKAIVNLQVGRDFEHWYPTLQRSPLLTSGGELSPAHRSGPQSERLREADGVYLRDPECLLFKEWAREDLENSSLGRGFLFTAVAYTRASTDSDQAGERYFFALDPEKAQGAHLYNLWAALQAAEVHALQKQGAPLAPPAMARTGFEGRAGVLGPYFADPWFDGGNYQVTLVASPYRGSAMAVGELPDLTDDSVVQVVVRELELGAYIGPVQVQDFTTNGRERAAGDEKGEPLVSRSVVKVEEATRLGLGSKHYRFAQVALDERLNLTNRRLAEQIGRQLWPFLEPAGVRTLPSDFVTRHLIVAPSRVLIWSRRGVVVAHMAAGEADANFLETQLGEVAGVAREIRSFQAEVGELLAGVSDTCSSPPSSGSPASSASSGPGHASTSLGGSPRPSRTTWRVRSRNCSWSSRTKTAPGCRRSKPIPASHPWMRCSLYSTN